jgi:hypothetical protein
MILVMGIAGANAGSLYPMLAAQERENMDVREARDRMQAAKKALEAHLASGTKDYKLCNMLRELYVSANGLYLDLLSEELRETPTPTPESVTQI